MFKMSTCGVGLLLAGLAACSNQSGSAPSDGAILGRVPTNHRASDIECTQAAPAGTCPCNGNCATSTYPSQWTCSSDGDCGDGGMNGRCTGSFGPAGCGCTYDSCAGDSDCPSGQTCACHGSPYTYGLGNTCVPGNCRVDSDCGTGGYCSPSPAVPCSDGPYFYCMGLGYYCHTPRDQCVDDSDCQGVNFPSCVYEPSAGYWKCEVYEQVP